MEKYQKEINEIIAALDKVDPASLKREEKEHNFIGVYHLILEMFQYINSLKEFPNIGESLSGESLKEILSCLIKFYNCVDQIQSFTMDIKLRRISDLDGRRADIVKLLRESHKDALTHLLTPLRLAIIEKKLDDPKAEALAEKIEAALSTFQKEKDETFASFQEKEGRIDTLVEQKAKELEGILETAREMSADKGVSKFAKIFDEQAKQNKKDANKWLAASGFMALVICAVLVWIFSSVKNNPGLDGFLQFTLAKVLLMSFLLVIFHHTIKNYNANMHLRALNEHRKNSLETFEAFFHAAKDPKIRDAVLIQATRAIFEAGETGYVSSKGGGNMTGIETIKIADSGKD